MKRIGLSLLCLALGMVGYASKLQAWDAGLGDSVVVVEEVTQEDIVYEMSEVTVKPVFPGGERAMFDFLVKNLKWPEPNPEVVFQGTVVLQFTVEKDGSLTNIKAFREAPELFIEEVIRVVKLMPAWTPGRNDDGEPVRANYIFPVRFKHEGSEYY